MTEFTVDDTICSSFTFDDITLGDNYIYIYFVDEEKRIEETLNSYSEVEDACNTYFNNIEEKIEEFSFTYKNIIINNENFRVYIRKHVNFYAYYYENEEEEEYYDSKLFEIDVSQINSEDSSTHTLKPGIISYLNYSSDEKKISNHSQTTSISIDLNYYKEEILSYTIIDEKIYISEILLPPNYINYYIEGVPSGVNTIYYGSLTNESRTQNKVDFSIIYEDYSYVINNLTLKPLNMFSTAEIPTQQLEVTIEYPNSEQVVEIGNYYNNLLVLENFSTDQTEVGLLLSFESSNFNNKIY